MTTMPPSMTAAERYLELLQQGDTHAAGVYLDRLSEEDTVDPWAIVEHLGHKLTRPAPEPSQPRATQTNNDPLQVAVDTRSNWNEALGAAGVFGRR